MKPDLPSGADSPLNWRVDLPGFANQPPALQSRVPCPTSKDRTKNTESFALSFQFFYVFSWMLSCTQFSSEILSQCSVCHFSLVLSVSLKTLQSFSVSCSLWMFTCTFYLHINFRIQPGWCSRRNQKGCQGTLAIMPQPKIPPNHLTTNSLPYLSCN